MSEHKHTPGPWTLGDDSMYGERYGAAGLIENVHIGHVCLMIDTDDTEVCEANARLIAAAPELLEALREADSIIHYMLETFAQGRELYSEERVKIRAAIAKAEAQL